MKQISLMINLIILACLMAACGATPAPQIIKETVKETVIVAGTPNMVEKEVTKVGEKVEVVTATPEPKERAVLRLSTTGANDLVSLDPHFATTTQDRNVVDMVFNGLVRYVPGKAPDFEADLAENLPEPEIVGGKTVWTFHLRKGVMCHPTDKVPSYELTADDVVYSLQKSASPDRSAYASDYNNMTFEALDDYTVRITVNSPISRVLFFPKVANYSGGFIVCKKAIEAMGDEAFKTHPVGTGPFMFESYSPQEKVVLAANDAYFRGRPLLDGVEYWYISDPNSLELALLAGELDLIEGSWTGEWLNRMKDQKGVRVDTFGPGQVTVIHFNTTKPPLDNPEVRKALAYATSREDIIAAHGEGSPIKPVYAAVPDDLNGGLTRAEVEKAGLLYEVDREKAKQMLADAGYPDGFKLEVVTSPMTGYSDIYENLQAQWAKIGVELVISTVDHSTYHTMIRQDTNPIVVYTASRPNADAWLTRFYHSSSIVVTGAKPDTNFSHYDQIDDLIEAARVEPDVDKQIDLWKQAQIKILEDMAAFSLCSTSMVWARSDKVDYGHELVSANALYPQIDENSRILK
jgi:peptide/nickel transport system substrate-binding protein